MKRSELYSNLIAALQAERKLLGRLLNSLSQHSTLKTQEQREAEWPQIMGVQDRLNEVKRQIIDAQAVKERALTGESHWARVDGAARRRAKLLTPFNDPDNLPPGYQRP